MNLLQHILLIVRTDVAPEMEEEFNRWYNEEHIPLLLRVPGVLWAKRGMNTGEGQKYIAVYEHESIEVQRTPAYRNALDTDWTHKIRPYLRNFAREIYELL
jgi:antibiotic biosynthesis monooxygenase (ABM) superfamily enzyme